MAAVDVLAIGEPLYELNRQPDGRWLGGFGGDTLNAAIAASRLGASSAYVTRLGGDFFAAEIRDLMLRERIDVSGVATDPEAPTGLYFVTHGPSGHTFTYRRKGSAASLMTPAGLDLAQVSSARIVHASGISQAISASAAATIDAAFSHAKSAGAMISYDTNFRPRLWTADEARPAVMRAAAMADILKTSAEDSAALFGLDEPEAVARHFLQLGAETVVVTLGRAGVLCAIPGRIEHLPGYEVEAVDATGAGDAFAGALLAELARGADVWAAARFANAAAALSTLDYGAIAPLPNRKAVTDFIGR